MRKESIIPDIIGVLLYLAIVLTVVLNVELVVHETETGFVAGLDWAE